jgi:hypothetical protein
MHSRFPRSAVVGVFDLHLIRVAVVALVLSLAFSPALLAQGKPSAEELRHRGTVKMLVGAGAATLGAVALALSHESASVNTSFGKVSASATNTGGVILGAAALGGGGYLIYLGSKDRKAASNPSPSIGFSVGKRTSVYFSKQW